MHGRSQGKILTEVQMHPRNEPLVIWIYSAALFTGFCSSLLVQANFLNPLLRRTASAKNSLRRAPSALFIEHGKVFQRKKVRFRHEHRCYLNLPAANADLFKLSGVNSK